MIFFRSVDCDGCAPCPTGPCEPSRPPEATVYSRVASASLSKCGFTEWPGYESTPPKYYYYLNLSGSLTEDAYDAGCSTCVTEVVWSYYGSTSYNDPFTCVETGVPSVNIKTYQNCSSLYSDQTYDAFDVDLPPDGFTESYTSTTHTVSGTNNCTSGNIIGTGTAYAYVWSEYTTGDLLTNLNTIIPAFSGAYNVNSPSTDYAYFDISSDEITATKSKMEYYIAWDPFGTSGACLKITWSEKFVAKAGYTTYTAMTYVWNGSATYTGIYTINAPTTEGTTTVVSVSVTCHGC